jgi:RNA polymerase sigma factor (sigma-70 family)
VVRRYRYVNGGSRLGQGAGPRKPSKRSREERNELALKNEKLIYKGIQTLHAQHPPTKKYYPQEDAYADAFIGLMRAAELYDETKGKFSTIAFYWIMQSLTRGWWRHNGIVHAPWGVDVVKTVSLYPEMDKNNVLACPDETYKVDADDFVESLLDHLPARYAYVLGERIKGRLTQEIATELNVSYQRIAEIQRVALVKLRKVLTESD